MRLSFVEDYRGVFRAPHGDESTASATWTLTSADVGLGWAAFDVAGRCDVAALGLRGAALRGTARFDRGGCAYALRVEAPALSLAGQKRGFSVAFVAALSTLALRVGAPDGSDAGRLLLRWDPRGGLGRLGVRWSW